MRSELYFATSLLVALGIGSWAITSADELPATPPHKAPENAVVRPVTLNHYIEVLDSCAKDYSGTCVVARSAPTTTADVQKQLRSGVVLAVSSTTVSADGHEWYQVEFNEWLRYPERKDGTWYVRSDLVRHFTDTGTELLSTTTATTTKRIVIDRSEQKLYAYEGDTLFLAVPVSTGRELTPTPRGTFTIFKKTPSRYMQGPIPGLTEKEFDLPGVPWGMYFTEEGGAIHGAYWHDEFGSEWSNGCVNLPLIAARNLYEWTPLGTPVTVVD
ncbi:MAG: L,D-transpeptidase [Candidatus Pacebacteria bacterium]|nr:L,D-transpeptidase [Candidatus Paceibacterota bacterium]